MVEFILFIFIMSCFLCVISIGVIYILIWFFKVSKNVVYAIYTHKLKNIHTHITKYLEFNQKHPRRHNL